MVAQEFLLGLNAFKTMFDMAKALKDMDNTATRNAAVIDLQGQILAAQSAQTSLVSRVGELEEEVRGFEKWDAEKSRYELKDIGSGIMAYVLKDNADPPEPAHHLCPDCYQSRIKSILQQVTRTPGMARVKTCQRCGWEAYIFGQWHPDHGTKRKR